MFDNHPQIIWLIVAVVIVGAIVYWILALKRRKDLAAWAESRGLQFDPDKDEDFCGEYDDFPCLLQGHDRCAFNMTFGTWNRRPYMGFDYRYVTGSGKNQSTHEFSAVIIDSKVPLKPLEIRHEGLFDKIADFLGAEEIHFESAEFSRKFHVKSADRKWAYDVIHPKTIELLLDMPTFTIQFATARVIAYHNSKFSVEDFGAAAELICGILDNLPDYVVEQQSKREEV